MLKSIYQLLSPLEQFLYAHPWLAGIFVVCSLILTFRYLTALFKVVVFLLMFVGVILVIARLKN